MKNFLVLAALTAAAAPAMASKARLTSLGNAVHLVDTQTVFVNTADIHYLGDYATIEFGATGQNSGSTINPRAEGGFVRSSAMGKWGAYLGRQSATVNQFIAAANAGGGTGTLLTEQNALDLFYGTELAGQKWGFGVHHSAAKIESASQEVSTLGLSLGVRNDIWDAYARIGLGGESKNTAAVGNRELKQKGLYDIGFGYWFDTLYVSAKYLSTKGDLKFTGSDIAIEKNQYSLNVIDNVKVEGGNFFYGAAYTSDEVKQSTNKRTMTALPVTVGMEMDAASWLVLRGSITQNVFLGEVKNDPGTTDKMANNTVVAAGVGVKFAKITLDATLAGATNGSAAGAGSNGSGDIDGDQLLANGSLTYTF